MTARRRFRRLACSHSSAPPVTNRGSCGCRNAADNAGPAETFVLLTRTMLPKLKAAIQIKAIIRGAEEAGALFLKLSRLDGTFTVLNQARRGEGELVWTQPLGDSTDEAAVAAYLEKQVRFDPDLWILEIEDRDGRAFVDEPIV